MGLYIWLSDDVTEPDGAGARLSLFTCAKLQSRPRCGLRDIHVQFWEKGALK